MSRWASGPVIVLSSVISLVAILLMLVPPGRVPADRLPMPQLDAFTPAAIDTWILLGSRRYTQEELNALVEEDTYSQTYEAIYLSPNNQHIFLSLSYGENQLDGKVHAHRPEYCYRAQGYEVSELRDQSLKTPQTDIPVRLLKADKPRRTEYITYWMTLSEKAVVPGWSRMVAQIGYGLKGEIPDGLLVRVSTISEDEQSAYREQQAFIDAWLRQLTPQLAQRLTGV